MANCLISLGLKSILDLQIEVSRLEKKKQRDQFAYLLRTCQVWCYASYASRTPYNP